MIEDHKLAGVNEEDQILFVCNSKEEFSKEVLNYPEHRIREYEITDMAATICESYIRWDAPYTYFPCFMTDSKYIYAKGEAEVVFGGRTPILFDKSKYNLAKESLAIRLENGNVMIFGYDTIYKRYFTRAGVMSPSESFESIGRYDLHRIARNVGGLMDDDFDEFAAIFPSESSYWDAYTEWYLARRKPSDFLELLLGHFRNEKEAEDYFIANADSDELERLNKIREYAYGYSCHGIEKFGDCYFTLKGIKTPLDD